MSNVKGKTATKVAKVGILVLFLILNKCFWFFAIEYDISYGSVIYGLYYVELFQILKDDAVKVLDSICQQIWKTQKWSVFIPIPKKGNVKECLSYHISSIQFSRSVLSDSLRPHESQHARPPCPSPTPGVHSDPCPLSW